MGRPNLLQEQLERIICNGRVPMHVKRAGVEPGLCCHWGLEKVLLTEGEK